MVSEPRDQASGRVDEAKGSEELEEMVPDLGASEDEEPGASSLKPQVSVHDGVLGTTGWQQKMEVLMQKRPRFDDLGRMLVEQILKLDTPLGQFTREYGHPMRPPPTTVVPYERRGDLLPIHPAAIAEGSDGITRRNVWWVKLTLMAVNFHYCTGWTKPCCIPMDLKLTPNQRRAIQAIAEVADRTLVTDAEIPTLAEAKVLLASKRYDYCGNPVEHMMDLEADKVIPTWPKEGEAAKCCITDFLTGDALEAMRSPGKFLLPLDKMPLNSKRSKVRASDDEWLKICRAAAQRGMMTTVDDQLIPRDRSGHLVVNGAGGVRKVKEVNGRTLELLRFISILVPTNEVTMQLPGAQDSLPYVGQLTALMLEKNELAFVESEDFTSAFNLFYVPDNWTPYFAYSKKVSGAAFGKDPQVLVRPALRVIPMGWHSAVTLVQMAVRTIVFDRVGVKMETSVEKEKPLPDSPVLTVVYLDNFDEIHKLRMVEEELNSQEPSETHVKFNQVCDELGLPRNGAKQLVHALSGAIQGGELDGEAGVLRLAPDKLRNFVAISLGLLCQRHVEEFQIRHWVGKAAFAATFRRPLFAILEKVFDLIQRSVSSPQRLSPSEIDEVMSFLILAGHAQSELRVELSPTISCTDASPYGGGSAVAQKFKEKSLLPKDKVEDANACGQCGRELRPRETGAYECPRRCGENCCSVFCIAEHVSSGCSRADFFAPKFGERFSGPNFLLTKACGQHSIAVQVPLDKLVKGKEWDFFTPEGKELLEERELDPCLKATHWAPECKTFSRARGRWIKLNDGRWTEGPKQVRSSQEPWGFSNLSRNDSIKVRQGNAMARRSILGLKNGRAQGLLPSLEHPYGSYIWDTPEMRELIDSGNFFQTVYSHCCFGGRREKWTCLIHVSHRLHSALHCPQCPGHQGLSDYSVYEHQGQLQFDTAEEAEYPWAWCMAYAAALAADLKDVTPSPVGSCPVSLESIIYGQVRGATRGLQNEELVAKVTSRVAALSRGMVEGAESQHLHDMMRRVGLRGTDVRIGLRDTDLDREVNTPYPAFRWLWRTVLAYRWSAEQHINILEITAVLVEYRRRLRDERAIKTRFLNVVDSLVTYYAVSKGRSGSIRMNRCLRRMMALNVASKTVVVNLWTLSKWNWADMASRKYAPKASR